MMNPRNTGGFSIPLFVNYMKRVGDLRIQRSKNPYELIRDPSVDARFWARFHLDYYYLVLYKCGRSGSKAPIFPHKYLLLSSLSDLNNPEIN